MEDLNKMIEDHFVDSSVKQKGKRDMSPQMANALLKQKLAQKNLQAQELNETKKLRQQNQRT